MGKNRDFLYRIKMPNGRYRSNSKGSSVWSSKAWVEAAARANDTIEVISTTPVETYTMNDVIEVQKREAEEKARKREIAKVEMEESRRLVDRAANKVTALTGSGDINVAKQMLNSGLLEGEAKERLQSSMDEYEKSYKLFDKASRTYRRLS